MSYGTIFKCANDQDLRGRVTACCAQEGREAPDTASYNMMWGLASASDVEAAYASAIAAENPAPGADEGVITDGMILSYVQANG